MNTQGTPKSLAEAIQNALCETKSGPDVVSEFHSHIKDFLAQKFSVAMMKTENAETEVALRALWKEILK